MNDVPRTVARADSDLGEVVLRRREEVLELVVNGAFAMDTLDTSSEVAMAAESLAGHPRPARVLIGGLGLGFTARRVLADPRVERLDVVELAGPLVDWARSAVVPELSGLEDDPRCRLHSGDVADVLAGAAGPPGPWDLVLLDVDNGPGFLLHERNAGLYAVEGLLAAYESLCPGGILVIWSSHPSASLGARMRVVADQRGGHAGERLLPVQREGRSFDYALYSLRRAESGTPRGA